MYKYIIQKFWATLITFILSIVIFYLMFVIYKGDPFKGNVDPREYEEKMRIFGINKPAIVRFGEYISGLFHGEFGYIYNLSTSYRTIPELMFEPLKRSAMVSVPSYFIGMIFGLFIGFYAGYKRGKIADYIINVFVTLFTAIPLFIFAIFMIIIGPSLNLPITFRDSNIQSNSTSDMWFSVVAPIIVISLASLASWTFILRNEVGSILASDYILSARTRGLSEWTIFKRYVFRNSMYPYIGSIITSFMIIFSSSLVIEKFFNVPGVSSTLVYSAQNGEINILMFNLIFFSSISLFTQVFVDIAQFSINPLVKANFNSKKSFITKIISFTKRKKQIKLLLKEREGEND
ncbi:MAG: ABC transporter permease [Mycoplasmatales bacterium]|nr:ABC transporter permease [Mycoplasmatales bacterium]